MYLCFIESIFEENEKVQTTTRECQIYTHDEVLPICSDVKSMNEISDESSDPSAKGNNLIILIYMYLSRQDK